MWTVTAGRQAADKYKQKGTHDKGATKLSDSNGALAQANRRYL